MNIKDTKVLLNRNAPDLLLAGGVISIIGGGIWAIKQTPKALKLLEAQESKKSKHHCTKGEKIKTVLPLYIPSIALAGLGVSSIICSRNMTRNKIAAMATAYTVSETALKTYKHKVQELVDPEKFEEITKEVVHEKLKQDPIQNKEVYMTTKPESLIYDEASGRYFRGSMESIEQVVNNLNKKMLTEHYIQLNEFYTEIGLEPIKLGVDLGWTTEHELIEVSFTGSIADNNEPCIVMHYDTIWV